MGRGGGGDARWELESQVLAWSSARLFENMPSELRPGEAKEFPLEGF